MFCTRCGANNLDNDQFCRSCSAPLTKPGGSQGQGASSGSPQSPYSTPGGGQQQPYPYSTPGSGQQQQPYPYSTPGGGQQQQSAPGYGSYPGYQQGYQQPYLSPAEQMPQYPYQGYPGYAGPASGRATASMIMSIISIFTCGPLLSIPGMIMGKMELNAIRQGQASPAGESQAKIGYIVGLIVTILSGLVILGYILLIFLGVLASISSSR